MIDCGVCLGTLASCESKPALDGFSVSFRLDNEFAKHMCETFVGLMFRCREGRRLAGEALASFFLTGTPLATAGVRVLSDTHVQYVCLFSFRVTRLYIFVGYHGPWYRGDGNR